MRTNRAKAFNAIIVAAVLLLAALAPATSAQMGVTRRVRFPRGRTTTVIKGAVVRGTQDRYILRAGRGQTMTVHVTSEEDNAVFEIFAPGSGRSMAGADSDWTGTLPRAGDYTIDVSPTRGNATYTLEISIR